MDALHGNNGHHLYTAFSHKQSDDLEQESVTITRLSEHFDENNAVIITPEGNLREMLDNNLHHHHSNIT